MDRVRWRELAAMFLVVFLLLVAISLLPPWFGLGRSLMGGGSMGRMMMGGMGVLVGSFLLITPIAFIGAVILCVLWLMRRPSEPESGSAASPPASLMASAVPCPHCGAFVHVVWRACPYCAGSLTAGGLPGGGTP